jgi:hypothetical protein
MGAVLARHALLMRDLVEPGHRRHARHVDHDAHPRESHRPRLLAVAHVLELELDLVFFASHEPFRRQPQRDRVTGLESPGLLGTERRPRRRDGNRCGSARVPAHTNCRRERPAHNVF